MKKKRVLYAEAAFVLGILTLALGTALMERADFGMSMVVVPAYLLHLKISQYLSFYTFGVSEYVFQAFLLCLLSLLMRRFRKSYLLSFVTAFIYGHVLDGMMALIGLLPYRHIGFRIGCYILGMVICALGVALLFRTYFPPEAYELFVKEAAARFHKEIHKTKMVYDGCSCLIGVALSFAFYGFGVFVGVKWGTIVCACVNGWMIGRISRLLDAGFETRDAFPWREKLTG